MTTLFERQINSPATHAFVIGVGSYPDAKPGNGAKEQLRAVPDIPSAADSAKLMCDWLLENKDTLAAPLASLEVLISDTPAGPARYAWQPDKPPDDATSANLLFAGEIWKNRLRAGAGDVALFYCCGHGARLGSQPVLFLADLNADENNPWTHLNLSNLGASLRQEGKIGSAFLFADACSEFIPALDLAKAQETRFLPAHDPFQMGWDKVLLLVAASEKLLAYDAPLLDEDSNAQPERIGRFTQTLLRGLSGASARWKGGRWTVHTNGLQMDLKPLKQAFYEAWKNEPFEPSVVMWPNDPHPITHPVNPRIPIVITTEPATEIANYKLCISNAQSPVDPLHAQRDAGSCDPWPLRLDAMNVPLYALAIGASACHSSLVVPDQPRFDCQVPVR